MYSKNFSDQKIQISTTKTRSSTFSQGNFSKMSVIELRKLFRILSIQKSEIYAIFIYSTFIGFLYLIVPITAQALVTIVSFGSLTQPLFVLAAVFFSLIFFSNLLRLLESILLENIQQKIFARISLKLAIKLTKFNIYKLDNELTSLVNRFFELFSIQKLFAFLILGASILITKSFFGIFLLAFYHPFLLLFDLVFLLLLLLIVLLPFKKLISSAIDESNAKYEIANWLEETAKFSLSFRFQNNRNFIFKKTDFLIKKYLEARQSHFKKIIQQFIGLYFINILANTGVLLIGGILVIKNQMSLGQLVAAETIIWSLGSSVIDLGKYLESFYDLVAACEKLNYLINLPIEPKKLVSLYMQKQIKNFPKNNFFGPDIQFQNVQFLVRGKNSSPINAQILSGERVGILATEDGRHSLLINALLGFISPKKGEIKYNNIFLKDYYLPHIRKLSFLTREESFFYGSLVDNLTLKNEFIEIDLINNLLVKFKLIHPEFKLTEDLIYKKINFYKKFSHVERKKLLIIRSILANSPLLIFDEIFDGLPQESLVLLFEFLRNQNCHPTILVTTYQKDILNFFNKKIIF